MIWLGFLQTETEFTFGFSQCSIY